MKTLLDKVSEKDRDAFDFTYEKPLKCSLHSFSGTVGLALDATIGGFQRIMDLGIEEIDNNTILRTLLNNGRIFRGISLMKAIESKSGNYSKDYVGILEDYTRCSLLLTSISKGFFDSITEFSSRLGEILDLEISQKHDSESWVAMNPRFSNFSAQDLEISLGSDDYVFIALGNGGIVPGFDVFIKLKQLTGERGIFYPIRFSRTKSKDRTPIISPEEKIKLAKDIEGRKVIIFDEDASSGSTLLRAEEFFGNQFPDNSEIIKRSNIGKYGFDRYL